MKQTAGIEVPPFRYLDDIKRFLKTLNQQIDESGAVLIQQQKLLASVMKLDSTAIKAAMTFDVTPTDRKSQLKQIRQIKTRIDPALTKIVVPGMKKLQSQYALAEGLYDKHKAIEQVETTLSLAFPNRQGPEYTATINQIKVMKAKLEAQLKMCFAFLNEVAEKHVPKSFKEYIDLIASLLNEHVIFRESNSFLYVSVDDGDLLFTNYFMLQDVANDEGEIAPHLYISVQWRVGEMSAVYVDLNHEYEIPNKLVGSGEEVGSVGEAVKAISDMLEMENFSSSLGVAPLALQLKVDPTSLNPSMFSYRDFISKVIVDENTISFKLRKEADSNETVAEISAQLYKELKGLLKTKNVRLTMKRLKVAGSTVITFVIVRVAEGGEFNQYDVEFLRSKFGLNNQALRKISNIINQPRSKEGPKFAPEPEVDDLAEITRKNQELMKQQMKNRSVRPDMD